MVQILRRESIEHEEGIRRQFNSRHPLSSGNSRTISYSFDRSLKSTSGGEVRSDRSKVREVFSS